MILKIFKVVWFISLMGLMVNLLYVYASLPEQVVVWEEGLKNFVLERDSLFYTSLGLIAIVNVLVYVFSQSMTPDETFRSWLHGLVITVNIFLVITFSFISLYNSGENFDFSRAGTVIYFGIVLMAAWLISWPVILIFRKFFNKPVV